MRKCYPRKRNLNNYNIVSCVKLKYAIKYMKTIGLFKKKKTIYLDETSTKIIYIQRDNYSYVRTNNSLWLTFQSSVFVFATWFECKAICLLPEISNMRIQNYVKCKIPPLGRLSPADTMALHDLGGVKRKKLGLCIYLKGQLVNRELVYTLGSRNVCAYEPDILVMSSHSR